MHVTEVERLLDHRSLQVQGRNGRWYDIRRNGATKRWKRDPSRVEIPCKVGFREAFRLCGNVNQHQNEDYYGLQVWRWNETLRERPDTFDSRTRE